MLFPDQAVIVRGGGDLGTGAAYRLHHAGFPILVTELARPRAVRRAVAVSTAVEEGRWQVEDLEAQVAGSAEEGLELARGGVIAVVVSAGLPDVGAGVVVDARMAKRNIDTSRDDAALVIGLGPGFTAGVDCHAVVETRRGHRLGRVIRSGSAAPNTGVPGSIGGVTSDRVLRAPGSGRVRWGVAIGDRVEAGGRLGRVGDQTTTSSISGVARGLIAPGTMVAPGDKIGDIDPRADRSACFTISDKSLAVGGGVLEATLDWVDQGIRRT